MQGQVVMAVDPRLYEKLDALTAALEKMASALHTADNGWKSSSQFCAEHRISDFFLGQKADLDDADAVLARNLALEFQDAGEDFSRRGRARHPPCSKR